MEIQKVIRALYKCGVTLFQWTGQDRRGQANTEQDKLGQILQYTDLIATRTTEENVKKNECF